MQYCSKVFQASGVALLILFGSSVIPVYAVVTQSGDVIGTFEDGVIRSGSQIVGETGIGRVSIGSGSVVGNTGSVTIGKGTSASGQVTVLGSGQWNVGENINVGERGEGVLNVNGGSVSSFIGEVGLEAGSQGNVTVGFGGNWVIEDYLRLQNSSTLTIFNGGEVSVGNTAFFTGADSDSTATVTVDFPGSTLATVGQLQIGTFGGTAEMFITSGGEVTAGSDIFVGTIDNGNGSLTVDGISVRDAKLNTEGTLQVGTFGGIGELTVTRGGQVTALNFVTIGAQPDGHGSATVNGATLSTSSGLNVGSDGGTGELIVTNGGLVEATDHVFIDDGLLTITDAGQVIADGFSAGKDGGRGEVMISNGGQLLTNTSDFVGDGPGSTGEVIVDGSGSQWINGDGGGIHVGFAGSGTVNISNGGLVRANRAVFIGSPASFGTDPIVGGEGTVIVDGSESRLFGGQAIQVGNRERTSGTLQIINGGQAESENGSIGAFVGSEGYALVEGNGSQWSISDGLFVGESSFCTTEDCGFDLGVPGNGSAEGELEILDGGVIIANEIYIGGISDEDRAEGWQAENPTGRVTVKGEGSLLKSNTFIRIGEDGRGRPVVGSNVAVTATPNQSLQGPTNTPIAAAADAEPTVEAQTIEVFFGGSLQGNGIVRAEVIDIMGGAVVAPGFSPGTLTIDGNIQFDQGGILEIEIAGTEDGEFDVLHVLGDADLNGAHILFSFLDGFLPSADDPLIQFLDVDGTLTVMDLFLQFEGVAEGFAFDVVSGPNGLFFDALNNANPNSSPIPEPVTFSALAIGVLMLFHRRRGSGSKHDSIK